MTAHCRRRPRLWRRLRPEGTGDSTFGLLADSFAAALRPDAAREVVPFPPPRAADEIHELVAEQAKYH